MVPALGFEQPLGGLEAERFELFLFVASLAASVLLLDRPARGDDDDRALGGAGDSEDASSSALSTSVSAPASSKRSQKSRVRGSLSASAGSRT